MCTIFTFLPSSPIIKSFPNKNISLCFTFHWGTLNKYILHVFFFFAWNTFTPFSFFFLLLFPFRPNLVFICPVLTECSYHGVSDCGKRFSITDNLKSYCVNYAICSLRWKFRGKTKTIVIVVHVYGMTTP